MESFLQQGLEGEASLSLVEERLVAGWARQLRSYEVRSQAMTPAATRLRPSQLAKSSSSHAETPMPQLS